jgi:hypothetical protein
MRLRPSIFLVLVLAAASVAAQVQNGVISGTVRDNAGAVVPDATVTATAAYSKSAAVVAAEVL